MIEEVAPELIAEKRHIFKGVSPNVDFYSGFVYEMLGIPSEMCIRDRSLEISDDRAECIQNIGEKFVAEYFAVSYTHLSIAF